MGSEKITLEQIMNLDLPPIIVYAIPVMLSLVLVEYLISLKKKRDTYEGKEFWSSVGIGIGNLLSSAVAKGFNFWVFWLCYYISPMPIIPVTWWSFILCFILLDLCRYYAHRVGHEQRIWWSTHVTHHSSERYNFAVSFRLSWIQHLKVIFFTPVALVGFDPFVIFICHQVAVLYQFWIHTEYINKLPAPFEYIFVTPSHHRVHHGRNPKYLDKNYGSTFIIWDRIFRTFQVEEEKVDYGITKPVNSYNPVKLVFHEFVDIMKDVFSKDRKESLWKTIFGPPK